MGQKLEILSIKYLPKFSALKGWFTLKNVFGMNFFIITLHNIRNVNSVSYSQYHRTTEEVCCKCMSEHPH